MIKLERTKAIEGAVKQVAQNHNFVASLGNAQYVGRCWQVTEGIHGQVFAGCR